MHTFKTGEPQCMLPATLKRNLHGHSATINPYITTVKTGGMVMLRIDKIGSDPGFFVNEKEPRAYINQPQVADKCL